MLKNFIVATDSSCDLSAELCTELDIKPVYIKYTLGDQVFDDKMDAKNTRDFYAQMKAGSAFKTSQINSTEYSEFFDELAREDMPVLYVCLGSGMSGSYNGAIMAANEINEKYGKKLIYVFDTLMASAGQGMLVMKAVEMRDSGATVDECLSWLEANVLRLSAYYTTPTLKYFVRGGRVSKVSGFVGAIAKINPILNVTREGALNTFTKALGTKAAEKKIVKIVKENVENAEEQTLYISHSDCIEEATRLGNMIKEECGFKDIFYTYIGTTIGAHTGPGLKAVFFLGKERK